MGALTLMTDGGPAGR